MIIGLIRKIASQPRPMYAAIPIALYLFMKKIFNMLAATTILQRTARKVHPKPLLKNMKMKGV